MHDEARPDCRHLAARDFNASITDGDEDQYVFVALGGPPYIVLQSRVYMYFTTRERKLPTDLSQEIDFALPVF